MKSLPLHKRPIFCRRILEVGGGHAPYLGVTHAVDKFPEDNAQRAGSLRLPPGVDFREGDLESIPYGDAEGFDFVYVSHVLEHVRNPDKAVAEINRVARRGYIETPSPLREQLAFPLPYDPEKDFHTLFLWSNQRANALHAVRKSSEVAGQFCGCASGKLSRQLFELQRNRGVDVEPLLPRPGKTSQLFFRGPIQLRLYPGFPQACAAGSCAYEQAVGEVRKWVSFPYLLASSRFRRLRALLRQPG